MSETRQTEKTRWYIRRFFGDSERRYFNTWSEEKPRAGPGQDRLPPNAIFLLRHGVQHRRNFTAPPAPPITSPWSRRFRRASEYSCTSRKCSYIPKRAVIRGAMAELSTAPKSKPRKRAPKDASENREMFPSVPTKPG